MNVSRRPLALACMAVIPFAPLAAARVQTAAVDSASASLWQLEWNLRVRHEQVDSDAFARDAKADTARLQLGLRAQFDDGWRGFLEGNGVAAASDHYNSGANGYTQYPAIGDPQVAELDQAWIGWQNRTFGFAAGRQALVFDNQR